MTRIVKHLDFWGYFLVSIRRAISFFTKFDLESRMSNSLWISSSQMLNVRNRLVCLFVCCFFLNVLVYTTKVTFSKHTIEEKIEYNIQSLVGMVGMGERLIIRNLYNYHYRVSHNKRTCYLP